MKRHPIQQIITRRLARTSSALAVIAMTVVGALPTLAAPPPNDDIANAVTVTEPLPFSNSVSTVEATTAPDDPPSACLGASAVSQIKMHIWFRCGGKDCDRSI
jgi:hypothetical protein